jgi:predicted lipid-binding transport protein (Tim44 family)
LRAGLIIGGLLLMFVGIILSITILFLLFGLLCGFIGFVMLIVDLATSSQPKQVVYYQPPPQATTVVYPPPSPQYGPAIAPNQAKYCTGCGTANARESQFCGKCGKRFLE